MSRSTEPVLADLLAEVAALEQVPPDGHFFDELGLDSLVMARFCARVRKRGDLPSISIEDVYRHPTLRSLAAALPDDVPAPAEVAAAPAGLAPPAGPWQHLMCGALQLLAVTGYLFVAAIAFVAGYEWIAAAAGPIDAYLRSVLAAALIFAGACAVPILAKWTLVGRWTRREIPVWSLAYFRFWVVKTLVRTSPPALFAGSPLYSLYLRALGARIGRGALILTRNLPVCTDLLTVGEGAVVRKDSFQNCYRAETGVIRTGTVTIGDRAFVGDAAVLDIDTELGDGAQLGHASALHEGQAVPEGARVHGSPALERTEVDYRAVEPIGCGALRRAAYGAFQILTTLAVRLPLAIGAAALLVAVVPQLSGLVSSGAPVTSWEFYGSALVASLALLLGFLVAGFALVLTVPRLLNRALEPGRAYRLYGLHYAVHRAIERMTNVPLFPRLLGDSSYIVPYLRWLGYDLSQVVQTGSNFGLEVKHENPYLSSIGSGTMIADGLSIVNSEFSDTSFRVSHAAIGPRNYLGNYVTYPAASRTGEDCLLATKAMVPLDGAVRERTGLLGSPGFEIPRSVQRDRRFDRMKRGAELRRRLAAKNRHNAVSIALCLLAWWGFLFGVGVLAGAALALHDPIGPAAFALAGVLAIAFRIAYFALVERLATAFRDLEPRYCSIYDPYFWWHERFWKLATQPLILDGTPFKSLAWRLLGVRIGRRVLDDGCAIVEKTLTVIGDDCALNARSVIQAHSQEDGTFKSDRIEIGAGCTVGTAALVHYGATMGDGSVLGPDSFLIKGEELPAGARWAGNPAAPPAATDPRDRADRDEAEVASSVIPRWTLEPAPGAEELRATVPDDLASEVRAVAAELGVRVEIALLAAHAKVLAALSGDDEATTGYLAEPGLPLACRIAAGDGSWRTLLDAARRAESRLVVGADAVPGPDAPARFDVVFDPRGEPPEPAPGAALAVGAATARGGIELALRYRTDALDRDAARRIAGYHLAALRLIAADTEAAHANQSLLSAGELDLQLEGFAGPRRELPDRRFHELFEERAREHPGAVAAVRAGRELSYGELNARANRIARALLARGLDREGVVAVVSERDLDWMAAVIAIFKAGGVYLPIEPGFPAERIARTLARAGCRLALAGPSTATLDRALETLPEVEAVRLGDALAEERGDDDLGVPVAAGDLAYIYFTSGSTGEPKGAMCEHAGMLNHLYAKIDDLRIAERPVVAQTAPQCFDISLWQLLAALLVGGRTVLVEQELILDFERFIERVDAESVAVLQVVPSYLDAILAELERAPRRLTSLRCLSVTGEAVTKDLVDRWFAARPGVELVNAYGLTETSDDTNHEVMDRPPAGDRVPLGRPVANVHVYVVDERLVPVPLGAPGEIVFSGVCVGRGYVNDPERTHAAFVSDPHRAGERLYRSGDRGRWRPGGKLEFLGRRDGQVKVSGYRIEIGDVESALARAPGVGQVAVVVASGPGTAKRLVGFYSAPRPLEGSELRSRLADSLPGYMVPSTLEWRPELPVTANGKIDRKALLVSA